MTRVRFAPSPTGLLHIGGAGTSLFYWLWARNQGGVKLKDLVYRKQSRKTADIESRALSAQKALRTERIECLY